MVQDGSVPLSFLKSVCEPIKTRAKAAKLVAEILHDASHRLVSMAPPPRSVTYRYYIL